MKCQKFTVSIASINALVVNGEIQIPVFVAKENKRITPRMVKYYNSTGASLGVTIIENESELDEKIATPLMYAPMPLDSGKSEQNIATHCQYIIITKLDSTSATSDLIFYCNNFYEIG